MAKIKFAGAARETFSWTSMGKAKSYSFGPGEVRTVDDNDLPYLLSFGRFSALEEVVAEAAPVVAETKRVDPFITVVPPAPVVAPIEVAAPVAPVAEPVVERSWIPKDVVTEEEIVEEEAKDKVDYTSFHKKDLVKLCKERKLSTLGNRDDLICRLVTFDNKK